MEYSKTIKGGSQHSFSAFVPRRSTELDYFFGLLFNIYFLEVYLHLYCDLYCDILQEFSMEFIEGSRGIYRAIRVLFSTPIYERALQICWHISSYKLKIALVIEFLKLQQKKLVSPAVTVEDMLDLLMEESKSTLRVQLWEFELEDFDDDVAKPLLKLVWDVNTSMQRRDIEFEARKLLEAPETMPPCFKNPEVISKAETYARRLTEQQNNPVSKLLGPKEVVMDVVPKVLQHLWRPPSRTFLNMPSQRLSEMAVSVTKAVLDRISTAMPGMHHQVSFSRSIRDKMVLSIEGKVRQMYSPQTLRKRLNSFAVQELSIITDIAVAQICELFESQTHTQCNQSKDIVDGTESKFAEDEEPALEKDSDPAILHAQAVEQPELDSDLVPAPLPPATPADESPANIASPEDMSISQETEERPEPSTEPDSAVMSSSPSQEPNSPPDSTLVIPPLTPLTSKPPALTTVQEDLTTLHVEEVEQPEPSTEKDTVAVLASPLPVTSAYEPPAFTDAQEDLTILHAKEAEQPEPSPEPDSAVVSSSPFSLSVPAGVTSQESNSPPDSTFVTPPPIPLTSAYEPPALTTDQEDLTTLHVEEVEQPEPSTEPGSSVVLPPPLPVTSSDEPPAFTAYQKDLTEQKEPAVVPLQSYPTHPLTPSVGPAGTASVLEGEIISEMPPRELVPQSRCEAEDDGPDLTVTKGRKCGFLTWLKKTFCCCFLP